MTYQADILIALNIWHGVHWETILDERHKNSHELMLVLLQILDSKKTHVW